MDRTKGEHLIPKDSQGWIAYRESMSEGKLESMERVDCMSGSNADNTAQKQHLAKYAFQKGQSGNPKGRPRGSRNKLGEQFVQALADDFETFGVAAIEKVRLEDTTQYLKVIASCLPKTLDITVSPFEEMTDAELLERMRDLDRTIEGYAKRIDADATGSLPRKTENSGSTGSEGGTD